MRIRILSLFFFFIPIVSFSQDIAKLIDSLQYYSNFILSESPEFQKYAANEKLCLQLEKIMNNDKSFQFPFDSIKKISTIVAPDKKFKIITWALPKDNGTFEYFGYILYADNSIFSKKFIALADNTGKITTPESSVTDMKNWYGAVYYKIILTHYQGKKHYTLLGWKGNNSITNKKVIEVLSFRSSGIPSFGAMLFRKYKDKSTRIIFEYSSRSSMLLRYDKQMTHLIIKPAHRSSKKPSVKEINGSKALKGDKKIKAKEKITKSNMIIFDRLSPIDQRTSKYAADLEGQYQFYAPESNICDAFIFINGRWVYTKDVDARNPKEKRKKPLPKPKQTNQ
ncbi:MAG: hypothetical protein WCQ95_08540 [Bacteroidota bacterium]